MAQAINTTRRNVLKALPATALPFSMAGTAATVDAAENDIFMNVSRTWTKSRQEWVDLAKNSPNRKENHDLLEAIWLAGCVAESAMSKCIPQTREGLTALVPVIWTYHGPSTSPNSPDYADEIAATDNKFILNLFRRSDQRGASILDRSAGAGNLG
jgi:hypothetical protein